MQFINVGLYLKYIFGPHGVSKCFVMPPRLEHNEY